jgi:2-oxoglutarate dehydrogenase E2 component (dihydrolipoamide succinyltransferase)
MVSVRVPRLGESVFEVEILRWLKHPGEAVALDEPLVELGTDKADVVLPSPAAGVLVKVNVAEGGKIAIGGDLATIEER